MVPYAQELHRALSLISGVDVFPMYKAMKAVLFLLAVLKYREIARTPSSRVYASRD